MNKRDKKEILILGITGGYGSGKSTVAGMFRKLGAACIDADRIYHQLIKPGKPLYQRLIFAFEERILEKNGQIDRKKLAKMVFDKGQNLDRLQKFTHPLIIRKIKDEISKLKGLKKTKVAIIDAPLLIEVGLLRMVDKLIVVKAGEKKIFLRCKRERGLSQNEITKRIKVQMPLAEKIKLADFIIDNDGPIKETRKRVKEIWKKIN